eukprot:jgi/Botrbrau1/12913/Bobra.0299s0024.1
MHIGTLSKAFGAQGGFIACSAELRALLLNRARSYIFSTALPVPVVAAAHAALRVSHQEPELREHLWGLVEKVGRALGVEGTSPIIPVLVGSEEAALAASAALLSHGFHVPAIRPPTVPPGTCRLRISLSAAHTDADIEDLIAALQVTGLIPRPIPTGTQTRIQETPAHGCFVPLPHGCILGGGPYVVKPQIRPRPSPKL